MSNRLPFSGSAGFSRLLPRYGMALLVLLCAGSLRAGEVEVIKDVVYGKCGGEDLLLDLVKPKDNGGAPLPGIVFMHGGGWKGGDKNAGIWILGRPCPPRRLCLPAPAAVDGTAEACHGPHRHHAGLYPGGMEGLRVGV